MKDIKKPEFMKAAVKARSHSAVLELLIALLVFFVGDVIVGVLQVPAMVIYLFTNKEYMQMILSYSVDLQKITDVLMEMPDWLMVVNLLLEAGLIVVFILYCRIFEKRKAETLGFHRKGMVMEYLKGVAIAVAMFVIAYAICVMTGGMRFNMEPIEGTTVLYVIAFLFGYLVQGMAEEVICRGYLLVSLSRRYSVLASVIFSAAFFSMLHAMNAGVGLLAFVNLFLFGVFMGLLFVRCENIWIVGAVHSIWNFLQGNVFGIQVSGMRLQPSLFTTDMVAGKEAINGGSFGVEGGLAVTLVLLASVALVLANMSKRGYFVEAEPVVNPYDQAHSNRIPAQNQPGTYGNVQGQNGTAQGGYNQNEYHQAYNQNDYSQGGYGQSGYSQGSGQNGSGRGSYSQNGYHQENHAQNGQYQSSNVQNQNGNAMPGQPVRTEERENMGLNPQETPWHPSGENPDERRMTGFDKNYFKEP